MAVERGGRGCAIAALAIASTSAALCGAFITYGGYKAFDLSARVANADTVVSEVRFSCAHDGCRSIDDGSIAVVTSAETNIAFS